MQPLLSFLQKPYYQVLIFLCLTLLYNLIFIPKNQDGIWSTSSMFYILFVLLNTILLLLSSTPWYYFFTSIGVSVCYVLILGFGIPYLVTLLKLDGPGESAMALLFVIYHPFFLLAMMGGKWIYVKLISDQLF